MMSVVSSLWVLEPYLIVGPTAAVKLLPRRRPRAGVKAYCACLTL